MKDNHISPIEAVESISRIADRPLTGENISFDTATMPFSVDSFVLKLFNLQDDQAERINVHNEPDGLHVYIRLKPVPCRCNACGNMTDKVKGYKIRKITHSVITNSPCFIDYDQRRMRCTECGNAARLWRRASLLDGRKITRRKCEACGKVTAHVRAEGESWS